MSEDPMLNAKMTGKTQKHDSQTDNKKALKQNGVTLKILNYLLL